MSVATPPSHAPLGEEPEALIEEARERQRRRRVRIASVIVAIATLAGVVYPLTARGGRKRPLASIAAPTAHATRLLVFFAPFGSGRAPHGLVEMDRHGRVLRTLSTARSGTYALWSPDDSMIAWKDPVGIHVERADGSARRLVVRARASCASCQALDFIWSPDARSLTVGSAGPDGNALQLVPIDGAAPRTLARSRIKGTFFTPSFWTTNGRSLVYAVAGTTIAAPGGKIESLTLTTGRTRTLWSTPNTQGGPNAPLIAPDGRARAYITEVSQYRQRLEIVDVGTGRARVVKGVNPTNIVAWSPDSRSLAVAVSGWHVVIVSAAGSLLHRLGPGQQFFWDRDGEVFILRAKYNQVWVSHDGRPETYLFHVPKNAFVVSLAAN